MIDYTKFQSSLKHLQLQLENLESLDPATPDLMREAVQESVIQRFEVCYDCLWKVLARHLEEDLGLPEIPSSPKPILRLAADNGLFRTPVSQWITYADARIGTSHDYSGEKAQTSLQLMPEFLDDAIGLFQTMTGKTWE
jgi:nucleotidyltransferase substrate binding protein (TIGR01987 family)